MPIVHIDYRQTLPAPVDTHINVRDPADLKKY